MESWLWGYLEEEFWWFNYIFRDYDGSDIPPFKKVVEACDLELAYLVRGGSVF